jgi:hypothetical protein
MIDHYAFCTCTRDSCECGLLPDEDQLECQMCGAVETLYLGRLADYDQFRCRACGWETRHYNNLKEDKK